MPRQTYLNVAEKPSVAKAMASILSNGTARHRPGLSQYNPVYEFDLTVRGVETRMIVTSVTGHLKDLDFPPEYRNWNSCSPVTLFDAPVVSTVDPKCVPIEKTLQREVVHATALVCWLDCDREGENISMEVVQVCRSRC
eukprot:RCo048462